MGIDHLTFTFFLLFHTGHALRAITSAFRLTTSMPRSQDAEVHRRDIERYRYLLDFLGDKEMRRILEQLLKEAQERLCEIARGPRS